MRICEGCQRHVREESCPFCGGASHEVSKPKARVSRATLIGAAAVAIACSSSPPQDDGGTKDGSAADSAYDGPVAAYGGPPIDAATNDAGNDAPVAAYGGPPTDSGGG